MGVAGEWSGYRTGTLDAIIEVFCPCKRAHVWWFGIKGTNTPTMAKHTGRDGRLYDSFWDLPVPVVLVLLSLVGVVLLGLCAAALYSYWLLLQAVA